MHWHMHAECEHLKIKPCNLSSIGRSSKFWTAYISSGAAFIAICCCPLVLVRQKASCCKSLVNLLKLP